jgi:type I restriction enzyme M protein
MRGVDAVQDITKLEGDLWEAADQLRANSKLTATEYSMPVLGLIFLRHAFNRFTAVREVVEESLPSRGGRKRPVTKADFLKRSAIFLPEEARFDRLANLPEGEDVGEALVVAMRAIEDEYESLEGALPKEYQRFEPDLLRELLRIFNREALQHATGDVFGRIYEYFLNKFAMTGAQEGGEFFTPMSLVQTIVNVIEPSHGTVLDPACGSGGMFVQTGYFIEREGGHAHEAVTFYGQEKADTTIRLARMNMAVHGLEARIAQGNTFYEDQHQLTGRCDFVMANPPFNVDHVDPAKCRAAGRLPFDLPGFSTKTKAVGNANYLWIQYFHSYLNETGRAGFVMASSASDAGGKDKTIRQKLVETGDVDVMIAIGTNFFYTRTLPCGLWFLDKGKPDERRDDVLMIDARGIHTKVTRTINDFSPEQLANVSAIVWLYRGEAARFRTLVAGYLTTAAERAGGIAETLAPFDAAAGELVERLVAFGEALAEENGEQEGRATYAETVAELSRSWTAYEADRDALSKQIDAHAKWLEGHPPGSVKQQAVALDRFTPVADAVRGLARQIDHLAKLAAAAIETATKGLSAGKHAAWSGADVRRLERAVVKPPRPDAGEGEQAEHLRPGVAASLRWPPYFQRQAKWLLSRFPAGELVDVPGLCKRTNRAEIEANDWSLTPGRYVGVAPPEEDAEFDFEERLREIHIELQGLNAEAAELAAAIETSLADMVG